MSDWHVDPTLASRYAVGALEVPLAASVEAHLTVCPTCQRTIAATVHSARLARAWTEIVDRLDAPRRSRLERQLVHVGLSEGDARLVVSAPAFRLAWGLSVILTLVFCVAAAGRGSTGPDLFLLLAPALPVLGVGLAYGPWVDPSYETVQSSPYSSLRLVLLRTAMVLVVTVLLATLAGALVPGQGTAVVWLLPAAAMVGLTLALSAWLPALTASLAVVGAWLVLVVSAWLDGEAVRSLLGPRAQLLALALLGLALVVVASARRAQAYDLRRFL